MANSNAHKPSVLLQRVEQLLTQKLSKTQATLVIDFANRVYRSVSESDLANRNAEDLYASILSLWKFCQEPLPNGGGRIRVTNPTIEEHGWQSKHTIIQLLHVDMPFMVDSTCRS